MLNVPIHLQDDWMDCGRACAQMVTRAIRGTGHLYEQSTFIAGVGATKGWWTSPDEMVGYLNDKLGPADPVFSLLVTSSRTVAMGRLRASINAVAPATPYPAVALVNGGDHWVVVMGVTGSGTKQQIHVRNPTPDRTWLPGATNPLPVHSDLDTCPTGDTYGYAPGQAPDDEVLSRTEWYATYFIKVTWPPAVWKHKYVVVAPLATSARILEPKDEVHPHVMPLDASVAGATALRGMELSGLRDKRGWSSLSLPPAPSTAVRVERLNGGNPFFLTYLSGTERGGAAGVDAVTGELLFARLNPPHVLTTPWRRPVMDTVNEALASDTTLPRAAYSVRLVWKLCRQTFYSPYFVLAELTAPGEPTRYLRLSDQHVFTSLS